MDMELSRARVESGRSRLQKALPLSPPLPIMRDKSKGTHSDTTLWQLPLPPLPKESPPVPKNKMSVMSIPRRPVGVNPKDYSGAASIASMFSTCSSSHGTSRSSSNSSNKSDDSLSGVDSEAVVTPPLPPKDIRTQQPMIKSKLQFPASDFQASPPRAEIWRRRPFKSERSITFPGLKLNGSNGSTAGPPPQRELPAVPMRLPPSLESQKPLPARPAPSQPDFGGMGNKLSRLKDIAGKGSSDTSDNVQPQRLPLSYHRRIPTPKYLKSSKQHQPKTPQIVSPPSPQTRPIDVVPPIIPQKAESPSTSSVKTVPDTLLGNTTKRSNILSSYSLDNNERLPRTNLLSPHSRDTSETLTITSLPQVISPQSQKVYATKILPPTSSLPPATLPGPSPVASPPAFTSPAAKLNIRFPKPSSFAMPGTIFQGPELSIVHLDCYWDHIQMRNSKNLICPVACMICRKKTMGPRWRCTWCDLAACAGCMQILTSIPERDLRVCLGRVDKTGLA